MNLFEILIVLFFIVLPLLQQVLGQKKGPGPIDPETGTDEDELADADAMRRGRLTRAPAPARQPEPAPEVEGWSTDWGEWPMEAEEAPREEPGTEEIPREEAPPARPVPERGTPTVVSLEPLHVDRGAEHARFHGRTDRVLPPVKERPARIEALVRGRSGLRTAILLAEVIGPPIALREPPGGAERG